MGLVRLALQEPASLIDTQGQGSLARQQVLQPRLGLPHPRAELIVQRRLSTAVIVAGTDMVLQVLADRRQMMLDCNSMPTEQRLIANSRELQQLRRLDRTGRHNDLARGERLLELPVLPVPHTGDALIALKKDLLDAAVVLDMQ